MPYWVITADRDLMGPYSMEARAQEIRDGLDDSRAEVRLTQASKRAEAVQELRHQDVEKSGVAAGHRNYRHKVDLGGSENVGA